MGMHPHARSQAILTLPDPAEWGDTPTAAVADAEASFHQTIEFHPAAAPGHNSRRGAAIFCGVSVARRRAAERVGRVAAGGGGGRGARRTGKVTVVSFVPTMSLTNLLATPADVRLSCPSSLQLSRRGGGDDGNMGSAGDGGGVWSDTIERGAEVSWFHCPPDEEVLRVCCFFSAIEFVLQRPVSVKR